MTGNEQRAARLRDQAEDAMRFRKSLLVCSVALAETATVAAARKVISDWDGPAGVKDAAVRLLDSLAHPVVFPTRMDRHTQVSSMDAGHTEGLRD